MSICPFACGTDSNGIVRIFPCRDDCELRIGLDCAFKVLAINSFDKVHANNPEDKPNKD